ncbi:cilia- and flagella-associated protein 36 [Eurytemora carolleeae]|uniref:cilia- and flagella-associated protein 36 n=1 Tax=Eurytemora carolleeae TaxID=1294199 RepID=UPI000C78ADC8|nr:cilia- and flagella-associated protein 36 [Eurytemora carolleeae]|eukprot:XP_023335388.1 cilia- and flagella-associated protein 36-like [Eurytemora affinis]
MEDDWIFDSLIGFLRGPVWNVPILTYIEHKSLVFEPGEENDEEYEKIHEEYKNLVDFMLGSYMDDMGINADQFEEACAKGKAGIKTQFQQMLFEQVWAADDFVIFKRMMIQKNIELQLQALELIQQRYGILPAVLQPGGDEEDEGDEGDVSNKSENRLMREIVRVGSVNPIQNTNTKSSGKSLESTLKGFATNFPRSKLKIPSSNDEATNKPKSEEDIFQTVLRHSKAEHEALVAALNDEEAELEKALAGSVDELNRLEAEKKNQEAIFVEHLKNANVTNTAALGLGEIASPITLPDPTEEVDPVELEKRTAFLRAQRDKLLELKRVEREKQLAQAEVTHAQVTKPDPGSQESSGKETLG